MKLEAGYVTETFRRLPQLSPLPSLFGQQFVEETTPGGALIAQDFPRAPDETGCNQEGKSAQKEEQKPESSEHGVEDKTTSEERYTPKQTFHGGEKDKPITVGCQERVRGYPVRVQGRGVLVGR